MGFAGLHTGRSEPTYIENLLFARYFVFEVFPLEYYSSFSDVKTQKKKKKKVMQYVQGLTAGKSFGESVRPQGYRASGIKHAFHLSWNHFS